MNFFTWLLKSIINSDVFKSFAISIFIVGIFINVASFFFKEHPFAISIISILLFAFLIIIIRLYYHYLKYIKPKDKEILKKT